MDEHVAIRTPENIEIHYTPAGIGSRFLALLIDYIILEVGLLVVLLVALGAAASLRNEAQSTVVIAVVIIIVFLVQFGYFIFFEAVMRGKTPGKRVIGLRVIRQDGLSLDFSSSLIRNLARLVDFLPGTYACGVVTMFINRQHRRLGDLAAGTVVVYDLHLGKVAHLEIRPGSQESQESVPSTRLSADSYLLIRDYLVRSKSLSPGARVELGPMLADVAERETGISRGGTDVDEYLKTVLTSQQADERPMPHL